MDAPWWQRAVFYQIYPRSFASGGRRPTGDLAGIEQHLDHLDWLGVDAVWLSPFYPSPMADFGYDVSDHCDVDPLFGDLDTFDRLLAACHARGLKLLVDDFRVGRATTIVVALAVYGTAMVILARRRTSRPLLKENV